MSFEQSKLDGKRTLIGRWSMHTRDGWHMCRAAWRQALMDTWVAVVPEVFKGTV